MQTVPAHATVKRFEVPWMSPQLTRTAGRGYSMLPGLKFILGMISSFPYNRFLCRHAIYLSAQLNFNISIAQWWEIR